MKLRVWIPLLFPLMLGATQTYGQGDRDARLPKVFQEAIDSFAQHNPAATAEMEATLRYSGPLPDSGDLYVRGDGVQINVGTENDSVQRHYFIGWGEPKKNKSNKKTNSKMSVLTIRRKSVRSEYPWQNKKVETWVTDLYDLGKNVQDGRVKKSTTQQQVDSDWNGLTFNRNKKTE